jgi:hypothetical protein
MAEVKRVYGDSSDSYLSRIGFWGYAAHAGHMVRA